MVQAAGISTVSPNNSSDHNDADSGDEELLCSGNTSKMLLCFHWLTAPTTRTEIFTVPVCTESWL